MSMTDDILGMSEADKEAYAESENAASEAERADDEWEAEDFDDEPIKTDLDGLIVDTRDMGMVDTTRAYLMNEKRWRKITLSAAQQLSANRCISASNFRARGWY
jgi:hypothetical protein